MTTKVIPSNSVYIQVSPGKTDRTNPSRRTYQKGSTDNRCLHYGVRIICPRQGDPDYPKTRRAEDRALSRFSKMGVTSKSTTEQMEAYKKFFASQGITRKDVLQPIILRNIAVNPDFHDMRHFGKEDQIDILKDNPSFNEPFVILTSSFATLIKRYRDICNLEVSAFQPGETEEETINRLIDVLKDKGPMAVLGYHGQEFYDIPAKPILDPVVSSVLGWTKPRPLMPENEMSHTVVICGAATFKDKQGKVHRRVYFVDPNDASFPEQPRKVYAMSVKSFIQYLVPFERMELTMRDDNFLPGYGIQKRSLNLKDSHIDQKGTESEAPTFPKNAVSQAEISLSAPKRSACPLAVVAAATAALAAYLFLKFQ